MMLSTVQAISEDYKRNERYRFAGQLDALHGREALYGCHHGMRSTRDYARDEYYAGHAEIEAVFRAMRILSND